MEEKSLISTRIEAHKKDIEAAFFDGQDLGEILSVSVKEADAHRGGQSVSHVRTQAGSFYYKPRSCGTDRFYAHLTDTFFSDITRTPAVVDAGSYAFFEEIHREPLRDKAGAELFFFRLGGMLAIFHALGSIDIHRENLVACGSMPVLVDTETILTPVPCRDGRRPDGRFIYFPPELETCIDETMMTPFRIVSGTQLSPLYDRTGHSMPEFEGEIITIRGFEESFLEGFRTICRRCIEKKEAIRSMLDETERLPVRSVLRNTIVYGNKMIQLMFARDDEDRKRILDTLDLRLIKRGAADLLPVSGYEKEAISRGDIPFFVTRADSHDLYAEDLCGEPLIRDFFTLSAVENALHHLEILSEEEIDFSCSLLSAEFSYAEAHLTPESERTSWQKVVTEGFPAASSCEDDLFTELLAQAVHFPGGRIGWVTGTQPKPQVCTMDNAWGGAGTAEHLSHMMETEKDTMRRDQAGAILACCLQELCQYLQAWDLYADELEQKCAVDIKYRNEKELIEETYQNLLSSHSLLAPRR